MRRSTYQQPLPPDLAAQTASGHYGDRRAVEGKWHVYPEMAAAGLWTTATDLARFAIEIQQSLAGKSSKVLSQATTRQMLTMESGTTTASAGDHRQRRGADVRAQRRDAGFDALLLAFAEHPGRASWS